MTNHLKLGFHYARTNSDKWPYRVKKRVYFHDPILEGIEVKHQYFIIKNSCITIEAGYHWNGCNGVKDTHENLRASLFHDVGYQCLVDKLIDKPYRNRKIFDKLFRIILKDDDMNWLERQVYYYALRCFGWYYA